MLKDLQNNLLEGIIQYEESREKLLENWRKERDILRHFKKGSLITNLFRDKRKSFDSLLRLIQQTFGLLDFGLSETCLSLAKDALKIIEKQVDKDEKEISWIYGMFCILFEQSLIRFGRNSDTTYLKKAESIATENNFHDLLFWISKSKMDHESICGRFNEVVGLSSSIFEIIQKMGESSAYEALALPNLTKASLDRGDFESARERATRLFHLAEQLGYPNFQVCGNRLTGEIFYEMGKRKEGLLRLEKAVSIGRDKNVEQVIPALYTLANIYIKQNNLGESKRLLEEAKRKIEDELEIPNSYYHARIYRLLGSLALKEKRNSEAEEYLKKSKKISLDEKNPLEAGLTQATLGNLYMELDKYHEATLSFEEAAAKFIMIDNQFELEKVRRLQEELIKREKRPKKEVAEKGTASDSFERLKSQVDIKDKVIEEFEKMIHSSLNINKILPQVLNELMELTLADRGFLILLDEEEKIYSELTRFKKKELEIESEKFKKFSQTFFDRVLETKEPLLVSDAQSDSEFSSATSILELDIRTVICMPIKTHNKTVGIIYIDRLSIGEPFTEEDLAMVESLAGYACMALLNARLFTQLKERAEKLQMFNDLTKAISSSMLLDDVLLTVLKHCITVTKAEKGYIFLGHDLKCKVGIGQDGNESKEVKASKSVIQKVIEEEQPLILTDTETDEDIASQKSIIALNIKSVMCVPLKVNRQVLGVVYVSSSIVNRTFNERDLSILEGLVTQASISVENAQLLESQQRNIKDLERALRLYEEAQQKANTDGLTGLCNHAYFKDQLTREFSAANRYHIPLSVLMIDLDNFKEVNDTHGHQIGDLVLKEVANILKIEARESDLVARYGGDEMVVILPNTDVNGALILAERLRQKLSLMVLKSDKGQKIKVEASIGLTQQKKEDINAAVFLDRVDQALFTAKTRGRDRICLWGKEGMVTTKEGDQTRADSQRNGYFDAITALTATIAAKDKYTHWHSKEMADITLKVGKKFGLKGPQLEDLKMASLLHDIGKVGIPDQILLKTGPLDENEWKIIKTHAKQGRDIILQAGNLKTLAEPVYYHHERWDGTGYPEGLKGEGIPLSARILAVIDAYEAMICDRPYRKALPKETAMAELKANAGTQFDTKVVEVFTQVVQSEGKAKDIKGESHIQKLKSRKKREK